MSTGATVWLTGLPSAGKTTIAHALAERLRGAGRRVEVLDGDEIREFLSAGLGFSREDRHTNVQRIGFVAELLASHGVLVLVPVIAPYTDSREAVRKRHQAQGTGYVEVHVATPVDVCSVRDVKGLYARQAAGELSGLTGVDDPYEVPEDPDLRIETQDRAVEESAAAVWALLAERGLVTGDALAREARERGPAGDAPAATGPQATATSERSRRGGGEARERGTAGDAPAATGPQATATSERSRRGGGEARERGTA